MAVCRPTIVLSCHAHDTNCSVAEKFCTVHQSARWHQEIPQAPAVKWCSFLPVQSLVLRVKRKKLTVFVTAEPSDTVLEVKHKLHEMLSQVPSFKNLAPPFVLI